MEAGFLKTISHERIGMASLVAKRLAPITLVGQRDTGISASPIYSLGGSNRGEANGVSHDASEWSGGLPFETVNHPWLGASMGDET